MKKLASVLIVTMIIALGFSSCEGPKDPYFQKIENLEVMEVNANNIKVKGDMTIHNPNPFSCNFKEMDLDIITKNGVKLTNIKQTYNTEMKAKDDFKVPVVINISPTKLIEKKEGILKSLINTLNEMILDLQIVGDCTIEVMEINVKVPVDYSEKIDIKKKK